MVCSGRNDDAIEQYVRDGFAHVSDAKRLRIDDPLQKSAFYCADEKSGCVCRNIVANLAAGYAFLKQHPGQLAVLCINRLEIDFLLIAIVHTVNPEVEKNEDKLRILC